VGKKSNGKSRLKQKGKHYEYTKIKSAGKQEKRSQRQIQQSNCPCSRRLCGWLRLGGRLQNSEKEGV
jgi:hypothetical protein